MSYRMNPTRVVREHFADETILINMDTCVYFSLNEAAREAFKLLEAGHAAEVVADALARDYAVDTTSVPDAVRGLVDELVREGLLEPADASDAPPPPAPSAGGPRRALAAPAIARYTDMQDLLLLDPIHDVDATGWPAQAPKVAGGE
jgi:hypothetical protein